jgi:MFS family permease
VFNIILLGFTSLFTDISSEMVYPLIPLFLASLGAGPAALGVIEGFAESLASLLKVFSGYISDRVGKRKGLTLAGYISSAFGKVILSLATGWGTVLVARTVDRIGKGIRTAPRDALIAESTVPGKRGRAFGLHRGMDTAGAVIGVGTAYLIIAGGGREYTRVFLLSIIPAFIGAALLFWLKEPSRVQAVKPARPVFRWHVLPKRLRLFLTVAMVFSLGNSSNAFLLLRSSGPGHGPGGVLLLYLAYNVSYMLLSYPAGRLSDMLGRKAILVCGYAMYGAVYLGFALFDPAQSAWLPWVLFPLYGVYSGLTDGVEKALVTDLAPQNVRVTAIGVHAMITGIGLLPASLLAGLLWEQWGPAAPFLFGGLLGLAAAAGLAVLLRGGTSTSPAAI